MVLTMASVRRRARRLESAVSICLLVLLLLIGLVVFMKQFDVDMSRFGIDTTTVGLPVTQIKAQTQEPVLDALTPDGFKKLLEIETYNTENLYEKINGKAPLYIEAGFVRLFTQRFISKNDESLWMELFVFDMAAIRNAFSVYSVQKRPDARMLTFARPQPCYKTSNGLYFVHGKFYVELIGSSESTALDKAMTGITAKFASQIALDDEEITELALFPEEDRVQDSFKLYLANAFGFDAFTDIFTCQYKLGDESITTFLSKRPDPQNARTTAESYYSFLIENDAADKPTSNKTLKDIGVKVLDFYDTTEIIFAIGPFIGGIHEAENQKAAEELAARLFDKLSNVAKTVRND